MSNKWYQMKTQMCRKMRKIREMLALIRGSPSIELIPGKAAPMKLICKIRRIYNE